MFDLNQVLAYYGSCPELTTILTTLNEADDDGDSDVDVTIKIATEGFGQDSAELAQITQRTIKKAQKFQTASTAVAEHMSVASQKLQARLSLIDPRNIDHDKFLHTQLKMQNSCMTIQRKLPLYKEMDASLKSLSDIASAPIQNENDLGPHLTRIIRVAETCGYTFSSEWWKKVFVRIPLLTPSQDMQPKVGTVKELGYTVAKTIDLCKLYLPVNQASVLGLYGKAYYGIFLTFATMLKILAPWKDNSTSEGRIKTVHIRANRIETALNINLFQNFMERYADMGTLNYLLQVMEKCQTKKSYECFNPFFMSEPEKIIVDDSVITESPLKIEVADDRAGDDIDAMIDDIEKKIDDDSESLRKEMSFKHRDSEMSKTIHNSVTARMYYNNLQAANTLMHSQQVAAVSLPDVGRLLKSITVLLDRHLNSLQRKSVANHWTSQQFTLPKYTQLNPRMVAYKSLIPEMRNSCAFLVEPISQEKPLGELKSLLKICSNSGFYVDNNRIFNKPTVSSIFMTGVPVPENAQNAKALGYNFEDLQRYVQTFKDVTTKLSFEHFVMNGLAVLDESKIARMLSEPHRNDDCDPITSCAIRRQRYAILSGIRHEVLSQAMVHDAIVLLKALKELDKN